MLLVAVVAIACWAAISKSPLALLCLALFLISAVPSIGAYTKAIQLERPSVIDVYRAAFVPGLINSVLLAILAFTYTLGLHPEDVQMALIMGSAVGGFTLIAIVPVANFVWIGLWIRSRSSKSLTKQVGDERAPEPWTPPVH